MSRAANTRAPTRKEQQGQASHRRILDAASGLMGERGFAGTSISAVSERSGLPASSIYWHFGSKEGLLGAVVEEGAQRWFDALPWPKTLAGDAGERIGALLHGTARSLEQRPEFLRLLFLIALERRDIDDTSLAMIRRVRELALERLRELTRRQLAALGATPPPAMVEQLALLLLAFADGAFIQNHIDPGGHDATRSFALMHRALNALGRELAAEGAASARHLER